MSIKRHVGRIKNTDRRCAVVFPQIPGADEYALIVDTDALPDFMHEELVRIIDSSAGQDSLVLADVLSRRPSPDSGYDMLNSLHLRGLLQRQKISNIMMYPQPNAPVELSVVVDIINKDKAGVQTKREDYEAAPGDRFKEKIDADMNDANDAIALGLIREAQMLEQEALSKREQAYRRAPHLRPDAPKAEAAHVVAETPVPDSEGFCEVPVVTEDSPVLTEDFSVEIIDDPTLDPEMKKILQQAQAHLQRAAVREETNAQPVKVADEEEVVVEEVKEKKASRRRPKKAASA